MKILSRQSIISLLVALLILSIGAFMANKFKSQKESTVTEKTIDREIRTVKVASFSPQSIKNKIEVDGRLTAYEKINLAAEVQGKLLSTGNTIKVGTNFKEGDLLFKIESKDDEFNLKAQRSTLYNLITQVMPDLKFDHPESYTKWLNYLNAFDPEQNVKDLPTVTNQKEKYFIGGKNIMSQFYTIKSLEEKMKNYNIYAPFNGVFLSVNNYPGSLVSPGASLAQIMNTYNYELVSPISMDIMKYVSVGQQVELTSEELGKSWKGVVNRTSKQIDQSTQSIPVYITVSGIGLRDGMYLKGTLGGSVLQNISILPKDAIVNQNQVFVYRDSILKLKPLSIINFVEEDVYVKGIDATDQVVISSTNNLFDGQKVKI